MELKNPRVPAAVFTKESLVYRRAFDFFPIFKRTSGYMSKPPVLFWFENRSHEIKEPPWEPEGV
jgi:hypothetical protein